MLSRETVCCVCALFRGNRSFAQLRSIALRFNKEKRRNLFLGLEDIGYFTPETAEEIRAWNPVYASLTWNGANPLAGGCMDDGGLTPKGKFAVRFLAECGICIDCAHLNRKSFAEVLKCESGRLVDSHTCMNGICRHPRNLEDWQAQARRCLRLSVPVVLEISCLIHCTLYLFLLSFRFRSVCAAASTWLCMQSRVR